MHRVPLTPRPNWQSTVANAGLTFHTPDVAAMDRPYWDESAAYHFMPSEIDTLEAAANDLQQMCLAAAQHIIDNKRYAELAIPAAAIPAIEWAWNNEPPALYGRFDIAWAGAQSGQPPKLLEYNADTPTSLLEAAVIQWSWLEDLGDKLGPEPDQFNSIHDSLIAKWKDVDGYLSKPVYFCALDNPEDQLTTVYLRDTAQQAGLETAQMFMEEIGWNDDQQLFLDPDEQPMFSIFKLYPWEAMVNEEFGTHAIDTYPNIRWIEPIWKMLLSNKGILPILWELYPNHDLLLPAYFEDATPTANKEGWQEVVTNGNGAKNPGAPEPALSLPKGLDSETWVPATGTSHGLTSYVRKPLLSREGANITMVYEGKTFLSTEGPYTGRAIIQALAPAFAFPDNLKPNAARYPVLGLWMVDQDCCGMGIRESGTPITDNLSSFIPHFIA